MIWIEATATIFGLLCVWLYMRQNIWCWPTGLVQVSLFIIIFYQVKLYSDLILHVIYVFMQLYGWYHWLYGGEDQGTLTVSRLPVGQIGSWIVGAVVGTVAWGYTMASLTDASVPYGDAFTTVTSLAAQWLIVRKKLESWFFWIAVDLVAIGIYLYKSLYFTTCLYTVFLVLATAGYFAWRKSLLDIPVTAVANEDRSDTGEIRAAPSGTSTAD